MYYVTHSMGFVVLVLIPTVLVLWRYSKKRRIQRLQKSIRVVFAFAVTGFAMAWFLLAVYAVAHYLKLNPSSMPLAYLCPASIMALGIDSASLLIGLLGWLFISISNAVLYSVAGMLLGAVLFPLWKSD